MYIINANVAYVAQRPTLALSAATRQSSVAYSSFTLWMLLHTITRQGPIYIVPYIYQYMCICIYSTMSSTPVPSCSDCHEHLLAGTGAAQLQEAGLAMAGHLSRAEHNISRYPRKNKTKPMLLGVMPVACTPSSLRAQLILRPAELRMLRCAP